MVSKKSEKKSFLYLGTTDLVLGKMGLFSIGNGAEIRPLEMGRNFIKIMLFSIVFIRRITTTKLVFMTGEILSSSCFCRKVSVKLHHNEWQLSFHLF